MQLHQLKSKHPRRRPVRRGRGGKRGTTSGRGTKGQKARAGRKLRPEWRDKIKKLPKLRGYRFASRRQKSVAVGLDKLAGIFPAGATVTPQKLWRAGLVSRRPEASRQSIKIVAASGRGVGKPFIIKGCRLSAAAQKQLAAYA